MSISKVTPSVNSNSILSRLEQRCKANWLTQVKVSYLLDGFLRNHCALCSRDALAPSILGHDTSLTRRRNVRSLGNIDAEAGRNLCLCHTVNTEDQELSMVTCPSSIPCWQMSSSTNLAPFLHASPHYAVLVNGLARILIWAEHPRLPGIHKTIQNFQSLHLILFHSNPCKLSTAAKRIQFQLFICRNMPICPLTCHNINQVRIIATFSLFLHILPSMATLASTLHSRNALALQTPAVPWKLSLLQMIPKVSVSKYSYDAQGVDSMRTQIDSC